MYVRNMAERERACDVSNAITVTAILYITSHYCVYVRKCMILCLGFLQLGLGAWCYNLSKIKFDTFYDLYCSIIISIFPAKMFNIMYFITSTIYYNCYMCEMVCVCVKQFVQYVHEQIYFRQIFVIIIIA